MILVYKKIKEVRYSNSSWELKKIRPAEKPITTKWIYHNAELWLISLSSDGSNWLTIADKNLWATKVWDYWKYYQWWNNYWWDDVPTSKLNIQLNASAYWPWNYYSSSTYITWQISNWWDSSNNANLRWWVTWTNEAMRWPCMEWYHIPSMSEFSDLWWIVTALWLTATISTVNSYLKLPANWYLHNNWLQILGTWTEGRYFCATNINQRNAWGIYCSSNTVNRKYWLGKAQWLWIRPFKNESRPPYEWETWWTRLK